MNKGKYKRISNLNIFKRLKYHFINYIFIYYFLLRITRRFFHFYSAHFHRSCIYKFYSHRSSQKSSRNCNRASSLATQKNRHGFEGIFLSHSSSEISISLGYQLQSLLPSLSGIFLFDQHLNSSFRVANSMPNDSAFQLFLGDDLGVEFRNFCRSLHVFCLAPQLSIASMLDLLVDAFCWIYLFGSVVESISHERHRHLVVSRSTAVKIYGDIYCSLPYF